MYTHDPVSLLALHHAEHTEHIARARRSATRSVSALRSRARVAYYAAVRRAYVRARAAQLASSRAAL